MLIKVTQDNINKGKRRCAGSCPIANALSDIPGVTVICAGLEELYFDKGNQCFTAKTPPEVTKLMLRFDDGWGMEPFEFEVEFVKLEEPNEN